MVNRGVGCLILRQSHVNPCQSVSWRQDMHQVGTQSADGNRPWGLAMIGNLGPGSRTIPSGLVCNKRPILGLLNHAQPLLITCSSMWKNMRKFPPWPGYRTWCSSQHRCHPRHPLLEILREMTEMDLPRDVGFSCDINGTVRQSPRST